MVSKILETMATLEQDRIYRETAEKEVQESSCRWSLRDSNFPPRLGEKGVEKEFFSILMEGMNINGEH
jgi:hypothetical protein